MTNNLTGRPSVPADIGQIIPEVINPQLLLDIVDLIDPLVTQKMPPKRSGFSYTIYVIFVCCVQILQLSPHHTSEILHKKCLESDRSFQSFQTHAFSNGKTRRFFPDQPSLSRCLHKLSALNIEESFWNCVLFAQLLLLKSLKLIPSDLKLIADYTDTPCHKNKDDPYCFGKKEGKTVNRTLTFSVIAGDLHLIIANFKIQRRQDKLPLFRYIISNLETHGFSITYSLLDRGFYRWRILEIFKQHLITLIMPGRKCKLTDKKITNYVLDKGSRFCKGSMKLKYVKKIGYPLLKFDLLLVAKRSFSLKQIKHKFKSKVLDLKTAKRRIFPLIVLFASKSGIKTLHGNESYIRDLYRQRWWIEIAFREMNRLGIGHHTQNRNIRLGLLGAKCFLYNLWQIQRTLICRSNDDATELELNEFLGKCSECRYPLALAVN